VEKINKAQDLGLAPEVNVWAKMYSLQGNRIM
jgi:hypothetical protein